MGIFGFGKNKDKKNIEETIVHDGLGNEVHILDDGVTGPVFIKKNIYGK